MKKILIITYYFPPCNLTSANRTFSWAKYLHKFGYYPTIITRNWDQKIDTEVDVFKKSGERIKHNKNDDYEVFYIPYKQSFRDKILVNYGKNKKIFLRKILTFFDQLSQFCIGFPNPYDSIYKFANSYLSENSKKIDIFIVSANPFVLFKYGYKLSKKYKKKWIADYRDDWTTTDWVRPTGFFNNFIFGLEKKKERKWVSSASVVTSVSEYYTQKISKFTGVAGHVIINGFFHEEFIKIPDVEQFDVFTITYIGSLYIDQKIEFFIEGFKKFVKTIDPEIKIKLLFAGLGFNQEQEARIIKSLEGFETFFEITNWLNRKDAIETIFRSHALLLVPAENIKGVPASKIYEYVASGKPVILCPNDHDIMESTLNESDGNLICETQKDIVENLNYLWDMYQSESNLKKDFNLQALRYSRENQTKKLVDVIKMFPC